jgi:hypothetical protein
MPKPITEEVEDERDNLTKLEAQIEQEADKGLRSIISNQDGYGHLRRILKLAHDQSATGKGKERHATGPTGFRVWEQQPILEISRMVGPGYAAGQVAKKVQEAVTMVGNRNFASAKAEALGAIVYAAALYKLLEEIE